VLIYRMCGHFWFIWCVLLVPDTIVEPNSDRVLPGNMLHKGQAVISLGSPTVELYVLIYFDFVGKIKVRCLLSCIQQVYFASFSMHVIQSLPLVTNMFGFCLKPT